METNTETEDQEDAISKDLPDSNNKAAFVPHPKPPNKAQHEKVTETLTARLTSLDERRRFLNDRLRSIKDSLAEQHKKRDEIVEKRSDVERELEKVNKRVDAKRNELQRLKTGLAYLREDRVDEQIDYLRSQMQKYNYKASEEKKFVMEIDKLNRSKKQLREHNRVKLELDELRDAQRRIRNSRDALFRDRTEVKKAEDSGKRDAAEIRSELDQIKTETDVTYNEKRRLLIEYKTQEAEYRKFVNERREEQRQKRREEKQAERAERKRELDEIKAAAEPFEEEINLLNNLMAYCLRFEPLTCSTPSTNASPPIVSQFSQSANGCLTIPDMERRRSSGGSVYMTPSGPSPATTPNDSGPNSLLITPAGGYRKDSTGDAMCGSNKSRRNSKQGRRNSKAKPITHNPVILEQFGKFRLSPPASTKDISATVEALSSKRATFVAKAEEVKRERTAAKNGEVNPKTNENSSSCSSNIPVITTTEDDLKDNDEVDALYRNPRILEEAKPAKKEAEEEEAFPSLPSVTITNGVNENKNGEASQRGNGAEDFFEKVMIVKSPVARNSITKKGSIERAKVNEMNGNNAKDQQFPSL